MKISFGECFKSDDSEVYEAGINVDGWGNRIECYGETEEEACKLRDTVMYALMTGLRDDE